MIFYLHSLSKQLLLHQPKEDKQVQLEEQITLPKGSTTLQEID
jgi:hypothetical protein